MRARKIAGFHSSPARNFHLIFSWPAAKGEGGERGDIDTSTSTTDRCNPPNSAVRIYEYTHRHTRRNKWKVLFQKSLLLYWHWDTKWLKYGAKNLNYWEGDRALLLRKSPRIFPHIWKLAENWILWILLWNWFQIKVQSFLFQYQQARKFYLF